MDDYRIDDQHFLGTVLPTWRWSELVRDREHERSVSVFWDELEVIVPFLGCKLMAPGVVIRNEHGTYRVPEYDMRRLLVPVHGVSQYASSSAGVYEFVLPHRPDEAMQARIRDVVESVRADVVVRAGRGGAF